MTRKGRAHFTLRCPHGSTVVESRIDFVILSNNETQSRGDEDGRPGFPKAMAIVMNHNRICIQMPIYRLNM